MNINISQLFCLTTVVISLSVFYMVYSVPEPNIGQLMAIGVVAPEISSPMNTTSGFSSTYNQKTTTILRQPFRPISEKKKMPPVVLPLPSWDMDMPIFLPPQPCPSANYWHCLPKKTPTPLSADMINLSIENRINEKKKILPPKLSILATEIQTQIRSQDLIILKDGTSHSGKIVNNDDTQILIYKENKPYTLLKDKVAKIERKMSFTDVFQIYWNRMSFEASNAVRLLEATQEFNNGDWLPPYYNKLIVAFPDSSDVYLSYARYLEQNCEWEQALQVYQNAAQRNINNEALKLAESELLGKLGLSSQALRNLASSNRPLCWLKAIEIAAQSQNWSIVEQLLQKFPANNEINIQDRLYYWQARLALQQCDLNKCAELCKKIRVETPQVLNLQAVVLYCEGNLISAIPLLEKALSDGEIDAAYNLALVYAVGGALLPAKNLLEKLLEQPSQAGDPSSIKAILGYWKYKTSPDKYNEANKLFQTASTANPNNPLVWGLWAEVSYYAGQIENATNYSQKALDINFGWSLPLVRLATIQIKQNQTKDAYQYLLEAQARLWQAEQIADIESGLAQICLIENDSARAYQYLLESAKQMPTHRHTNKLLAWQVNMQGNSSQALAYLDRATSQKGDDEYIKTAKKMISDNQKLMMWEDSFSRDDGPVRRRWQEIAQDGVEMAIRQQKIVLQGTNLKGNISALLRWNETANFHTFRIQVDAQHSGKSCLGVFYGVWDDVGIFFGKTSDSQIAYTIAKPNHIESWKFISSQDYERWPNQPVLLSIEQSREQKNVFLLKINNKTLEQIQFRGSPQRVQVGIYGFANIGESWQASFDNAQILETEK